MEGSLIGKYILESASDGKGYVYRPAVRHLLSRVAKVPPSILEQTRVYSRSLARYIPFYSAQKGGGGITLGSDTWQSITYTENFFSTDQELFNGRAYGNDVSGWLSMSAHEAGHLLHAVRYRFFILYLIFFAYQYLRYGHDAAPLEIEAEAGNQELKRFKLFLGRGYGPGSLENLLTADMSDGDKIASLDQWWGEYEEFRGGN